MRGASEFKVSAEEGIQRSSKSEACVSTGAMSSVFLVPPFTGDVVLTGCFIIVNILLWISCWFHALSDCRIFLQDGEVSLVGISC